MSKTRTRTIDANALKPPTPAETFLRGRIRRLESETRRLRGQIGKQQVFAQATAEAIVALDPLPPIEYTHASKKSTPVTPVIKFSDWHIGEIIKASETEGFGRYNFEIARTLALQIADDFLKWVEMHRMMYPIEDCAVFCEGDYISGDIHEELSVTNEFPVPVQTAKAGLLLAEVIRMIAAHFKRVQVYEVAADNHGRLVKKPQAKQKSSNSMSHLVFVITNAQCEKLSNVDFIGSEGAKILADIQGKRFLIEHGDAVKAWAGIPIYGMERHLARESRRRMRNNKGFDYWCLLPGQKYWLANGTVVRVEEIETSSRVAGICGCDTSVGEVLNRTDYTGNAVSFRVSGLPDRVEVTQEHPVFALRGWYPSAPRYAGRGGNAQPGHTFIETGKRKPLSAGWTRADELKKGDWVYYPVPRDIVDVPDLTIDHMRLLGLFASEGWVSENNQYVKFAANPKTEQKVLDEIRVLASAWFDARGADDHDEHGERHAIRFSQKRIGQFFRGYCGRLAWNKKLSDDLMLLPLVKQRRLLESWIDGDGHRTKYQHIGTSTSENLARQMYVIACRLGLRPSLWKQDARTDKNGGKHRTAWQVNFGARRWKANLTRTEPPHYVPHRITEIKTYPYSGPTFNCSVPLGEAYIVNGILLHNSIGHWHVPSFIQMVTLVNGSLSGTTEFDYIQGRHAGPSQLAFFVHPRHGVFNLTVFNGKP